MVMRRSKDDDTGLERPGQEAYPYLGMQADGQVVWIDWTD